MTRLPRGTVTFLFTDIAGSTRLWDAFPEDMRHSLRLHDGIVTHAVTEHGGHVVKQTGDGIFAVFDSAIDACLAAIDTQNGLRNADWPPAVEALAVRMALHTATADPEGGDYHGPDVNRVARIEAAGHGGQILISSTTRALIANSLPYGVNLVDLGSHMLRGMSAPERVFQLSSTERPAVFPPLQTASSIRTRLPDFPTTFIGRDIEIAEVVETLADTRCRLLTLLGPGGIGKTRLAVAVAEAASDANGVAAHFLSLIGVTDSSDVIKALGDSIDFTFDIHISAQIPEKAQLLDRLRAQPLMLLLDNLEHLPDIGFLVAEMLEAVPTLKVLATSRIALDVAAEWKYEVRGFDDQAEDAVQLFAERAHRAGGKVDLDNDSQAIRRLADLLGGMPLGIELAAAWTGVLDTDSIIEEIRRDAAVLESSSIDIPDRHRSIRRVFEQSWELLPEDLRPTYASLSIFTAPFDRTAASAVAGASLADLAGLTKRSLLSRHGLGDYALHPLLREFASEQVAARDPALAERYARHYWAALNERASELQGGPNQMAARDEVAGMLDHIRAAADYWVDHFPDQDIVKALLALRDFYFLHSWVDEAAHMRRLRDRFESTYGSEAADRDGYLWTCVLLATAEESFATPDELVAILDPIEVPWRSRGGLGLAIWLTAKGVEVSLRGDYEASMQYYDEAAEVATDTTPLYDGIYASWRGWSQLQMGQVAEATQTFEAGLAKATADGHYLGRAFLLSKFGLAAEASGDHETATQLHHEGREIFVKAGDVGGQGYTLSRLSWSYYLQGDFEAARRYALEGLAKFEEINHRWGIAVSYGRLGLAEMELGKQREAADAFLECLRRAQEAGLLEQQHYAITGLGRVLGRAGRHDVAASILAFETTAESNPYAQFAQMGLDELTPEAGDVADSELTFEATLRLAETGARELIEDTARA